MTREEAKEQIKNIKIFAIRDGYTNEAMDALDMAIKALEQKPCDDNWRFYYNHGYAQAKRDLSCDDCISRQAIKRKLQEHHDFFIHAYGGFSNMSQNDKSRVDEIINCIAMVVNEPSVTPKEKTGHCKDCKYFEYDSVAKVNGIPLIVAHEICSRWGDGCKTKEDGYCFLFESQESEG